jgi:predicted PurR-regulated permease PerM
MCEDRKAGQFSASPRMAEKWGALVAFAREEPLMRTDSLRSWILDAAQRIQREPPTGAVAPADASQHGQSEPSSADASSPTDTSQSDMHQAEDQMHQAEDQMVQAEDQMLQAVDYMEEAENRMQETVDEAAALAEETGGLGSPGRPVNRRSPFFIGMSAAAGVAVTYGLAELTIRARSVLVLIGLALFIAAGLDPAVTWLTRHRLPRGAAVVTILLAAAGVIAAFIAAAIPPMTAQATALTHQLPHYMQTLQDHNSQLGRLNARYGIETRLSHLISTRGSALIGGVLGAGELVLSAATSLLIVVVLTVYFLVGMPRIKLFAYRLAPHSRRTRVILIGDEIFTKVGGYVLGNFLTSVIAGLGTYIWLRIFGVPYPILLALLVALLDLIPVIGSTVGGAIVTLVALTVSLPIGLATLGFYIGYRMAEDYLLVPRIMGRAVQVPAVVSVVAVLVGGALMGIIGALVAIPAAAALRLLLLEVTFRRLDSS